MPIAGTKRNELVGLYERCQRSRMRQEATRLPQAEPAAPAARGEAELSRATRPFTVRFALVLGRGRVADQEPASSREERGRQLTWKRDGEFSNRARRLAAAAAKAPPRSLTSRVRERGQ